MHYRWDPPYPSSRRSGSYADSHLRCSDAERNEVAEKLARHFADGRLDQAEYRARLDRAMGATTRGDLGGLFDDLPRLSDEVEPRAPRRRRVLPLVLLVLVVLLLSGLTWPVFHVPWGLVAVVAVFIWFRAGHHHVRA